jgi:hypothetical protein
MDSKPADDRYASLRDAVAWSFPELDRANAARLTLRILEVSRAGRVAERLLEPERL